MLAIDGKTARLNRLKKLRNPGTLGVKKAKLISKIFKNQNIFVVKIIFFYSTCNAGPSS